MEWLLHWIKTYSYLGVFASLMLGMFGLPVPDETILAFTGFLISTHHLKPAPAVLFAYLGSICGITVNYLAGRFIGFPLLHRYGVYLRLRPEKLDQARRWFERHGRWTLSICYLLPGLRHLIPFIAGASRLEYPVFSPLCLYGRVALCGNLHLPGLPGGGGVAPDCSPGPGLPWGPGVFGGGPGRGRLPGLEIAASEADGIVIRCARRDIFIFGRCASATSFINSFSKQYNYSRGIPGGSDVRQAHQAV
jgi:membrane protein DedA with SNARE-associated domain